MCNFFQVQWPKEHNFSSWIIKKILLRVYYYIFFLYNLKYISYVSWSILILTIVLCLVFIVWFVELFYIVVTTLCKLSRLWLLYTLKSSLKNQYAFEIRTILAVWINCPPVFIEKSFLIMQLYEHILLRFL